MIKIEVESTEIKTKSGQSAKTGKNYSIREQDAWAFLADPDGKPQKHPVAMKITLEDNQAPYPVGAYVLQASSVYVADFGRLSIGRVRMNPIPAAAAPVRAAA